MAKHIDGRPRQQQIAAELRAQIMAGDLPAGSRLPTIQQLMAQFGVANQTIQGALKLLREEGFVVSQRGTGIYVRDRQPFTVDVAGYFKPQPDGYAYRILKVAEVRPPADVARALDLPEDGVAVLRHRLTLHGGDPIDLHWSYYPVEIARGTELTEHRRIKGGAPRVLAELGYPESDFVDEVSVRPPTSEEMAILELPENVPVIRQFRILRAADGRVVEVSVLVKGGHLYSLRYRQRVQ